MKKRSLKTLKLNKQTISDLNSEKIKGGDWISYGCGKTWWPVCNPATMENCAPATGDGNCGGTTGGCP
ncbi:hypothetical protein LS482_12255 [Sinomicrobium kalidii]|uniref:hypothetical protein n=1 Tax=Sinomicrobium kalidii TaxID=2900738 RepID=UPI001E44182A|nr:hypothetical protein [Sinomicrobium kalidii]UGU14473.1 hypothetical protein LS482_12255 [Sinomicrobium kalidii]